MFMLLMNGLHRPMKNIMMNEYNYPNMINCTDIKYDNSNLDHISFEDFAEFIVDWNILNLDEYEDIEYEI